MRWLRRIAATTSASGGGVRSAMARANGPPASGVEDSMAHDATPAAAGVGTPVRAGAASGHQRLEPEPFEPLGVSQSVDPGDAPVDDREGHEREGLPPWRHQHARRAVD